MNTFGQHLLVEYHGCDVDTLDSVERIERSMNDAAVAAEATVVASTFHRFAPQGVSGVVVIEDPHLAGVWLRSGRLLHLRGLRARTSARAFDARARRGP